MKLCTNRPVAVTDEWLHYFVLLYTDDASRVILSVPDALGNDYINASFIDVSIDIYTSNCI